MCDKCGNSECCRTVITKQGLQGIQGVVGPPGATGPAGSDADINAVNVENAESTALGWFKQKVLGILEFFSASGSDSIFIEQDFDEIKFSIKETDVINHIALDADITSTQFTISTINSKIFDYKLLHNKMVYASVVVDFTGTYTGITGDQSVGIDFANLPINFYNADIIIGYLQSSSLGNDILGTVRSQVAATAVQFAKSSIPFTNGNAYTVRLSFSCTVPIV